MRFPVPVRSLSSLSFRAGIIDIIFDFFPEFPDIDEITEIHLPQCSVRDISAAVTHPVDIVEDAAERRRQ